MKVISETCYAH